MLCGIIIKLILGIFILISIFLWEHIYRPSVGFDKIADLAIQFWGWCGKMFAVVSSGLYHLRKFMGRMLIRIIEIVKAIIQWLHIEEMYVSLIEILKSLHKLVTSVKYFFIEYYNVMVEYKEPILITLGSILIVCIIVLLFIYRKKIINALKWLYSKPPSRWTIYEWMKYIILFRWCTRDNFKKLGSALLYVITFRWLTKSNLKKVWNVI